MKYTYSARRALSFVVEDALLAVVVAALVVLRPHDAISRVLLVAVPIVLAWGMITLHYPAVVEVTDEAIVFRRYGRAHRFAWSDVKRVRLRRFFVGDRVMVILAPSPPWRGRYWLLRGLTGYAPLVEALEARARSSARGTQEPDRSLQRTPGR